MGAKGATEIIHRADLGDTEKISKHAQEYEIASPTIYRCGKGFIDEVIQPRSTRKQVSRAFAALRNKN